MLHFYEHCGKRREYSLNHNSAIELWFNVETKLFIPAVEKLENTLNAIDTPSEIVDEHADGGHELMKLSEREKEIIRKVAKGHSNKEIADILFISTHTVATHRRNIASKLVIHSPAGLIIFAILHGLVDVKDVTPN